VENDDIAVWVVDGELRGFDGCIDQYVASFVYSRLHSCAFDFEHHRTSGSRNLQRGIVRLITPSDCSAD